MCVSLSVCAHARALSVMSTSLRVHVLQLVKFPSENTGVCCHFLLQGIFPTHRHNPPLLHLLHWQADSLPLHHLGSKVQPEFSIQGPYTFSLFAHNSDSPAERQMWSLPLTTDASTPTPPSPELPPLGSHSTPEPTGPAQAPVFTRPPGRSSPHHFFPPVQI